MVWFGVVNVRGKNLIFKLFLDYFSLVVLNLLELTEDPFQTVYEHVKYGGPDLWKILNVLYNRMFDSGGGPSGSLMAMILPLFKGKGLEACKKRKLQGHNYVSRNNFKSI